MKSKAARVMFATILIQTLSVIALLLSLMGCTISEKFPNVPNWIQSEWENNTRTGIVWRFDSDNQIQSMTFAGKTDIVRTVKDMDYVYEIIDGDLYEFGGYVTVNGESVKTGFRFVHVYDDYMLYETVIGHTVTHPITMQRVGR